jgi:hypothetical protein
LSSRPELRRSVVEGSAVVSRATVLQEEHSPTL